MARQRRYIQPGTTYHLISRFVDRAWFIRSSDERAYYLKLLGLALDDSDWQLLAYCVMSNHFHLSAVAGEQPLSEWIRRVHGPFADFMNRVHDRIGPVFVRGPKTYVVPDESLPHLLAYIHNNPVRAGVCDAAARSGWTSHRAYVGLVAPPKWLHVSEGLARAGFHQPRAFDAWVDNPERATTEQRFTEAHYRRAERAPREADQRSRQNATVRMAHAIVVATARALGVSLEQMLSPSRSAPQVIGRSVAVQVAKANGVPGRAIARALQLSQQRVSELQRQPLSAPGHSLSAAVAMQVADNRNQ